MLYNFYVDLVPNLYKFHYKQENNGTIYNFNYWTNCLIYDFWFYTQLREFTITPIGETLLVPTAAERFENNGAPVYKTIGVLGQGEHTLLATADSVRSPKSHKKIGFVGLPLPNKLKCFSNSEYKQTIELKPNQHYSKNGILIRTTDNTLYIEDQFGIYDSYFTETNSIRMELYYNQNEKPISLLEPQIEHLVLPISLIEWQHLKQKLIDFVELQSSAYHKLSIQTALEHLLIHAHSFLPTKLFVWFKWEVEGEAQRSKHLQNQTKQTIENFIQNLEYSTTKNEKHTRKVVV